MEIIKFGGNFISGQTGNWIADIINWLVNGTSVAIGIILFTLILKFITAPFDIISRFSMRKNSLKMEQMRPELEKLQKQYSGDKMLYNQKMTALYKKNGYSMWGACLPVILTLVIFFVAISGFNTYSQYKNREYFYEMCNAYNNVIYAGFELDGYYISRNEEGNLIVKDEELIQHLNNGEKEISSNGIDIILNKIERNDKTYCSFYTKDGYMEYEIEYKTENDKIIILGLPQYNCLEEKLDNSKNENGEYTNKLATYENDYLYFEGKSFKETELNPETFLNGIRRTKSAEKFRETNSSFAWVKNIWVTDSAFAHPVSDNEQTLNSSGGCSCNSEKVSYLDKEQYDELTYKLNDEKNAPNGFFILVILTAGISLLMQLITAKSQKAQMELQTVDGQGAQTQKMMTWLMPILMAVFAFIYTAAFSIYIILSSVISMLVTVGANYIAEKKYGYSIGNNEPIRGRVYVKKETSKDDVNNRKKKKEEPKGDFLNSEKENKKAKKYNK